MQHLGDWNPLEKTRVFFLYNILTKHIEQK